MLRSELRRFLGDIDPNALRIMVVTMILSALMLGVSSVTRALFVLRLDLGTEFFGVYNSFGALGYTGMALPAGLLSRLLGLRRSMIWGVVLFAAGFLLTPLVEYLPRPAWTFHLLAMQLVSSGGYAIFTVNSAPAIMASTRPDNRSKTYGMLSSTRNFGSLVGMLGGGALPAVYAQGLDLSLADTAPYRIALLSCAAVLALGLYAVTRCRDMAEAEAEPTARPRQRDMLPVLPMGLVAVYIIFSQSAIASSHSFFNAYMDEELRLSPQFIGGLGALGQLCAVLMPFSMPGLRKRMDNGMLLFLSSLASGVLVLPLVIAGGWPAAGLGRMGLMAMSSIWMPAIQMYQMEMVRPEGRPLAFALLSMALGISFGVLSFFGGYAISAWGYRTLFLVCALITMVGSFILLSVQRLPIMQPRYAN